MVQTFTQIRTKVLRHLDEVGDTGNTKNLVGDLINSAYLSRLLQYKQQFLLWDTPEILTTVSGTQLYSLHSEFWQPYYFFNRTAKDYVREVPAKQLEPEGIQWNTETGSARTFSFWGRTPVNAQPSSASVLTIVSTSASDTTSANAVTIRGLNSAGSVVEESITPTGTTPAVGTTSFTKILRVTKAAAWTGTLTITSNSGAVTNLVLIAGEYGRSYQQFFLHQSPSGAESIEYRFYRQPLALVNDNDPLMELGPAADLIVFDTLLNTIGYAPDIAQHAAVVQMWSAQQARWAEVLEQFTMEGQSIGARNRFVKPSSAVGDDLVRFNT